MSLKSIHRANVSDAIDLVREEWNGATPSLMKTLKKHYDCDISDAGLAGTRVKMLGITATSTAGLDNAVRNWAAAARRKLDAEPIA